MPGPRGDEPWLNEVFTNNGRQKLIDHIVKKIEAFGLYDDAAQRKERAVRVEEEALFCTIGPVEYLKKIARSITDLELEAANQMENYSTDTSDSTSSTASALVSEPTGSIITRQRPEATQLLIDTEVIEDANVPEVHVGNGALAELPASGMPNTADTRLRGLNHVKILKNGPVSVSADSGPENDEPKPRNRNTSLCISSTEECSCTNEQGSRFCCPFM